MIAGYIYRYQYLDLFFHEFRYTHHDLTVIKDTALLIRLLSNSLEEQDREYLRVLDLFLEENEDQKSKEHIERSFFDFIKNLHRELFQKESEVLLKNVAPEDPKYLAVHTQLIQKAKQLGLK